MKFRHLLSMALLAIMAINASAQKDVTSQYITNATLADGTNGWTVSNFNAPKQGNNTKGFASEAYSGWGAFDANTTPYSMKQTITLPAGHYTLVNYAFYREGEKFDTDAATSRAKLFAGSNEVAIKTLGSIKAAGYANSQAEGANVFDSKMYRNTVDFTIDADNTEIEIGMEGTFEVMRSWCIAGMFELINNDILATIDAPFDVTGYITNPGFEYRDMTGWTLSEEGAIKTQNNNQAFKVGGYYAEQWQSANDGALTARSMSQTISGLPAGYYKLIVNMGGNGTYVDVNGKTVNWEEDKDYTVGCVLAEGEDLVITAGKTAEGTANWIHFDNFRLQFCGDVASALNTLLAQVTSYESKLPAKAYANLSNGVSAYDKTYSDVDELLAAIGAIQELYSTADLTIEAGATLAKMKAFAETTNVFTQEAYDAYYTKYYEKYTEGTLTATDANALQDPAKTTSVRAAITVDDLLLSVWTIGGEQCKDFDKSLYINTWSVEANGKENGSGMFTPFFEYWVSDANNVAANKLQATMTDLEDGAYDVSALVRVRIKNDGGDAAKGVTLQVADGTPVDVCDGQTCDDGTQFRYGTFTAKGETSDGTLKITFDVAEDNNISWLSFRNVKYTRTGDATAINEVAKKATAKTIFNVAGQQLKSLQKGLNIVDGKKIYVK